MGKPAMIDLDCLHAEELRALLDGELDGGTDEQAHAHLDGCEDCRSLYYDLVDASLSSAASLDNKGNLKPPPTPASVDALARRITARAAAFFAKNGPPPGNERLLFTRSSWSGVRLAAESTATKPLLVDPTAGVQVYTSEELEVRIVEYASGDASSGGGTLVLIEATLAPSSTRDFSTPADVVVTDGEGRALDPFHIFVRPLVWTATFTGGGTFIVRIVSRDLTVRVEVLRPQ